MPQKIQIIIEDYDAEQRIIHGVKVGADNKSVRFKEKGFKVDEFKKLIRKKFGDDIEIINKVRKNRDVPFGERSQPVHESMSREDDGISTRDIVEIMKNKYSD